MGGFLTSAAVQEIWVEEKDGVEQVSELRPLFCFS